MFKLSSAHFKALVAAILIVFCVTFAILSAYTSLPRTIGVDPPSIGPYDFVGESSIHSQSGFDRALRRIANSRSDSIEIEIDISDKAIDFSGLATVPQITFLRVHCNSDDSSIKSIPLQCGIEQTSLLGPGITNSAIEHLLNLPNLRELSIQSYEVDDHILKLIGKKTTLEKLSLSGCNISDEALEHLQQLRNLISLDLSGTFITDAGIQFLLPLSRLDSLRLRETSITDRALNVLAKLQSVRSIHLDRTLVSDEGVEKLSELPELTTLSLSHCDLTDNSSVWDSGFHELEKLDLTYTSAGDNAFNVISKRPRHISISIEGMALSYPTISEDRKANRNFVETSFSDSSQTSNVIREHLGLLPFISDRIAENANSISRLYLAESDVTDEQLESLPLLPWLREISICNTQITDRGLVAISKHNMVSRLSLAGSKVRDLTPLVNWKSLRRLHLDHLQLHEESIDILERLPELEEVLMPICISTAPEYDWVKRSQIRVAAERMAKNPYRSKPPFGNFRYDDVSGLRAKSSFKFNGPWTTEKSRSLSVPNTRVRSLIIANARLDGSQLEVISNLRDLRDLTFANCELPADFMSYIQRIPYLTSLILKGSTRFPGRLSELSELSYLQELWLEQNAIEPSTIKTLSKLPHLRHLALHQHKWSDHLVESILQFPQLEELHLADRRFDARELFSIRIMASRLLANRSK